MPSQAVWFQNGSDTFQDNFNKNKIIINEMSGEILSPGAYYTERSKSER